MAKLGPNSLFENNCQKYFKILAEKLGVLQNVKSGLGVVMSGISKASQIAKYVWEYPVNLTDISQERPQNISQEINKNTKHQYQIVTVPIL